MRTSSDAIWRDIREAASSNARDQQVVLQTGPGDTGEGDPLPRVSRSRRSKLARQDQRSASERRRALGEVPWHEERLLALLILVDQHARGDGRKLASIHRLYLRHTRSINNWDLVDVSAAQIVGSPLARGAKRGSARSRLLWDRRIAMIATYHYIRKGEFSDALAIAELLPGRRARLDSQSGRVDVEGNRKTRSSNRRTILRKHAHRMPRTMLPYAIEHFPESLPTQVLARRSGLKPEPNL